MNHPTLQRIHPLVKPLRRVVLHLLLILVIGLKVGLPEAAPAYAQAATATSVGQSTPARAAGAPTLAQAAGDINPCDIVPIPFGVVCDQLYPPPEILYLSQGGLYAATASQTAALRNLENQAVATVLALHGLPSSDDAAVRTWGRDDVLTQLYFLLVEAIDTTASARTTDQQNAVGWITTVAKRQNVAAAQNAAREYVKWAGLNRGNFDALLRTNPTKAQLLAYLSGPVVNYDLPTVDATEGWCAYRSPAPYSDEYQGYNVPVCFGPVAGIFLPPTPTYEQFVKWGSAKANYPLLSSQGYLTRAQSLGIAMGIAIPLGAVIGGYATYVAAAAAVANTTRLAAILTSVSRVYQASTLSAAIGALAVAGVALVTTLIAALATAIILGINVTDAANLPGKLATLVDTARTTTPDAATLVSSTDATTSLIGLFVAVTTPTPSLDSCDNSLSLPPGMYPLTDVGTDTTTLTSSTPCLNPTVIPSATATDPKFIVRPNAGGPETLTPTISIKDATSGTVTTARLSGTWFIIETGGSTAQTLRLAYTDWSGTKQNAWLIGNPTDGYAFLTFAPPADASTTVDPATCGAAGSCGVGERIKYIGPDGQLYSATVRPYLPPTGTPTATNAVEGRPVTLNTNGFAPGGAIQPVTYLWEIKSSFCNALSCQTVASLPGDRVIYTWQTGGTYQVDLTATDRLGAQATTRLQVPVSSVPPTLTFAPDCPTSPSVPCNTWSGNQASSIAFRGKIGYAGSLDHFRVTVNWGDGSQDAVNLETNGSTFPGSSPLTFTPVAGQLALTMLAAHSYAGAGVYNGTVTVTNVVGVGGDGGTITLPFSMAVIGNQTISFPLISGHSYGDVFTISATGGNSGQPVNFSTTTGCALSNASGGAGTGTATVTVISVGYCDITASQAGTATYNSAPNVTQQVFTLLANLSVTASSPTINYGAAVPAITPIFSGFKLSDTAAVLTTPPTCVVAANTGQLGTYATSCSGAVAPNYAIRYTPGTLTITSVPVANPTQSPPPAPSGWNNTNVTVTWNWTDSGSSIDPANCTTSSVSSGSGTITLTATCRNLAGNLGSASYQVRVDPTAPTANPSQSPAANAAGWNSTDVTVDWNWRFTGAIIDTTNCTNSRTSSGEGTLTLSATCGDVAGNQRTVPYTVKVDKTAPVVIVDNVSDGATYPLGSVPTAACSTTDALSGAATLATVSVTGGTTDGTGTFTATCSRATDVAGNSAAPVSVSYTVIPPPDTTAPVITPQVVGTLGNNGWYVSDVNLTWSVVDAESAISSQSGCAPVTVTSDTASVTFTCAATSAGGSASQSATLKRDATAPTISAVAKSRPNANGWYMGDVTVAFSCADALAGVASCPADQALTGEGSAISSIAQTAADAAGNTSAPSNIVTVKIDRTAPALNPTISPSPVRVGQSATISPNASDALSGVASASCGALDTSSAGARSVICTATDNAGNQASVSVSYSVLPVFPTSSMLDSFTRANGGVSSNWDGVTGTSFYKVAGNKLDVGVGGPLVWKSTSFGTSQEAFVTLSTIDSKSPAQGVLLKVQTGSIPTAGAISVVYDAVAKAVRVSTLRLGQNGAWTLYSNKAATFANGDVLGARANANGTVQIYKNGTLIATVTLNAADQAFFNAKGGKIGIWTASAPNAILDDFGGGTVAP